MRCWIIGAAVLAGLLLKMAPASAAPSGDCAASGELHFVCGPMKPEDLVQVPGIPWIITSGMAVHGGGLFLVNAEQKTTQKLNLGVQIPARPDSSTYPGCTEPPRAADFAAHGLSLRTRAAGQATLYVVGHGGREAIEVFDVRSAGAAPPSLSWIGCVIMPSAAGTGTNAVVSIADGTIYATVMTRAGTTMPEMFDGRSTGDVYEWKPGGTQVERLPGLSLAGDNGIVASRDGRELYVNVTGSRELVVVSRAHPSQPLRSVHFQSFLPDNVHWGPDGQLIVAGMRYDEPACGPMKPVNGQVSDCHRGAIVALVNPTTLAVRILYSGHADPVFAGCATGLIIGRELWLSSFMSDRVAYVNLPQ